MEMSRRTEDLLCFYWRALLAVPEGTPKIGLFAETGTLRTKWRIWLEKMLVNRIQQQKTKSLARMVYEEQLRYSRPGLAKEVTKICEEVKIYDVNLNHVTKEEIKDEIFINHYKDMKSEMDKY